MGLHGAANTLSLRSILIGERGRPARSSARLAPNIAWPPRPVQYLARAPASQRRGRRCRRPRRARSPF